MMTNQEINLTSPSTQEVATSVGIMPGFYGWPVVRSLARLFFT